MNESIYVIVPHKNNYELVGQFTTFVKQIVDKYNNVFFIIVDDNSLDKTTNTLQKFLFDRKNIVFLESKSVGVSAARNTGLEYVYGLGELENKWILFCDFDDILSPTLFEHLFSDERWKLFDYMLFGFTTNFAYFNKEKNSSIFPQISRFPTNNLYDLIFGGTFILQKKQFNLNAPWAKLIKARFIKENTIFFDSDLYFKEDLVFNLEILKYHPNVGIIYGTYYYYYINPFSTVRNFILDMNQQNNIVLGKIKRLLNIEEAKKMEIISFFLAKSLVETMHLYVFNSNGELNYSESQRKFNEVILDDKLYEKILRSFYIPKFKKTSYLVIYILTRFRCFNVLYVIMKLRHSRK
ncbi:glycosyltransferase family A protein [Weissella paramesenteroides]